MEGAEQDKIDELKESIELLDERSVSQLPFDLFERKGNRTTKLIITSGEASPIGGKRRWFDFSFKELTLVSTLTVELSGYSDFSEFDVKWVDESGEEHEVSARPNGDKIVVLIDDICRSVSFRPPTILFFSTYVNRVIIEGVERSNLGKALASLADIDQYAQEIIEIVDNAVSRADARIAEGGRLAAERAAIQREITQQKTGLARTKKAVEDASLKRSELIAQNGATESAISQANSNLRTIKAQAEGLEKQRNDLRVEVTNSQNELKELQENINIFPSEIVGFANQARRTGWQYFALAAVPIVVMVVMFILLINGAANLTTILEDHPKAKIQDIMVSRIPYVTIAVAIITASYKLARAFFLELIKINTQRLNLTKISIIARDVSAASEHALDLSQEEIYRLRTELKMDLLRDHMKEYLSKDFKVHIPSRIIGMLPFGKKDVDIEVEAVPKESE